MARTIPNKGYGGIYGEEAAGKSSNNVRSQRANNAANDFAAAEKSASEAAPKVTDNTTSSSSDVAENGAAGQTPNYSGTRVTGGVVAMAAKTTQMGRFASMFRGGGGDSRKPLIAMGGLTGIVAVLMMLVSSTLPIHLISNFGDLKNTLQVTNSGRSNVLIRRAVTASNPDTNIFTQRTKVGVRRMGQMNNGMHGAGFHFEYDGSGNTVLFSGAKVNADGSIDLSGATKITNEIELKNMFDDNPAFRTAWNDGTKTMTGKGGGWFSSAMAFTLKKNRLTRNLFKNFIAKQEAIDNLRAAQARLESAENINTKDQVTNATKNTAEGENGVRADPEISTKTRQQQYQDMKTKLNNDIKMKASQVAKGIATGVAAFCGIRLAIAAVSAVYAMEAAMRGVAVVAGWFEAGQKPLAGDGDDSYHAFGDILTTGTVTTSYDDNENEIELHGGTKMSPTEARGLQAILVGSTTNSADGDQSALQYHADKAMSNLQVAGNEVTSCSKAAMIGAGISIGIFAVQVVVGIFTMGIGAALIEIGKDVAGDAFWSIAQGIAIQLGVGVIVPLIARLFIQKLATDVFGEDFGNMVGSFGSRYFGQACQGNGCSAMSYDKAFAYFQEQQTVLAHNAELDRATRSPFDITSQHTFLGKISSNLAFASAGRSSSILGQLGALGTFADTMRTPVTVSAASIELRFREQINWHGTENGCARLDTIGAVGDMFCNPVRGSDLTTANLDPEFIYWKTAYTCDGDKCSFGTGTQSATEEEYNAALNRSGTHPGGGSWSLPDNNAGCSTTNGVCTSWHVTKIETDNNGIEKVNSGSSLAKMIEFGVNRDTDPGITDANIIQKESELVGGTWATILNAIPLVGDVIDIIEANGRAKAVESGWADGRAFCAGCEDFPKWESSYKYLNQYIVDNNLYEGMGGIEKSPVVAYMEDVLWPQMDMSYEGRLAANMGMPKAWVEAVLAYADDMRNVPREIDDLVASAPNIYSAYYGGINADELTIPKSDNPYKILENAKQYTQIAGTELRRRFNAEAIA